MQDKKAVKVLIQLLNKNLLNAEEKAAVQSAIGIMSWTALSQSRIKKIKDKKEKNAKW